MVRRAKAREKPASVDSNVKNPRSWVVREKGSEHYPPPLYSDGEDGGDEGREQEGGRDDMQVWAEGREQGDEGREQEGGRDDMQVWAEGREQGGGADGMQVGDEGSGEDMQVGDEGDLEESDYQVEEDDIEDDDKLYETHVDQEIMEKGDESSGDSDVAYDGDILDEMRISDNDEHDSPIVFNPDIIFNPSFELGMIFGSKDEFRKAVQSHVIQPRRTLHFPKNDKIRIYARCRGDGCDWGINLVKIKDQATFHIRLYNPSHECPPVFKVDGWRKRIMKELNVNISRQQAYRAKIKALEIIVGKPDEQYSKLWDYAQELRTSNPKSTIVEHSKSDMLLNNVFECFNAAILDARDKPVITMFEWLRQWLMTRLRVCRDRAAKSWKAIVDMGLDPEDFVHTCYSLDTYKRVYEHPILPISGQLEWVKTLYIPPMPPSFLRKIGRPATASRVEPEEKSRKKDKVDKLRRRGAPKLSCTKCGRVGHNTRTCKEEAGHTSQPINVQEPAPEGMADYIPEPLNVGGEQSEVNDVSKISPESILNSHQEEMRVETEDDQAFEELLTEALISTEALLSQPNSASQFQNLGMPSVPTTVGPTPFQQLHNLVSTPRMLSGPNIRAPPPFVNGGMRPQFSTQSHYESRNKRIIVDGGTKYLDLSQESLQ
ncbi:hypothetical protein ACS0TY_021990 [Phlomoides rotata]